MNKYLMLSAAMAVAGAAATQASAGTWQCGGLQISSDDGIVYAAIDGVNGILATGIAGKNKNFNSQYGGGKRFVYLEFYATHSFAYGYSVQLPIQSTSHWVGFATSNGTSTWEFNAGTCGGNPPRPPGARRLADNQAANGKSPAAYEWGIQ